MGSFSPAKFDLVRVARPVLQLILLVVFLFFFGLPAIATYRRKEVLVVENKKDTGGIPFPAITVAAWIQEATDGCYQLNKTIEQCIEDNSLGSSDLIKGVLLGFEAQASLNLTKEMLTEDSTHLWSGRFYTLNLPLTIGPDDDTDQVYIFLSNISMEYQLFIHDPKFYIYSDNPVLPMEVRSFNTRSTVSRYYRLNLVEMNELDVPSDPCNTAPDFNFHSCVKMSVAQKVSCSLLRKAIFLHLFVGWL